MSRKERNEHIVNQFTTWMDPPYCHCELEFMNTKSLAVYANQRVQIRQREFDPLRYDTIKLHCEEHEYNRALATAHSLTDLNFSWLALLNCYFQLHTKVASGVCCSQICAEVLQAGNLISENINPAFVSPSRLHVLLQNENTKQLKYNEAIDATNDALDWKLDTSAMKEHVCHI